MEDKDPSPLSLSESEGGYDTDGCGGTIGSSSAVLDLSREEIGGYLWGLEDL